MSDYEHEYNYEKDKQRENDYTDSDTMDNSDDNQDLSIEEKLLFKILERYQQVISLCDYDPEYKCILIKAHANNLVNLGDLKMKHVNVDDYFPIEWFDKLHAEMIVNLKYIYVDLMRRDAGNFMLECIHNRICESYEMYLDIKKNL
jgi:hypothetical protein